jgi:hypothetical protein
MCCIGVATHLAVKVLPALDAIRCASILQCHSCSHPETQCSPLISFYGKGTSEEGRGRGNVLTDEQYIDGAKVEFVEEGHGRHAFSAGMHAYIKLLSGQRDSCNRESVAHHDRLSLVLYHMA